MDPTWPDTDQDRTFLKAIPNNAARPSTAVFATITGAPRDQDHEGETNDLEGATGGPAGAGPTGHGAKLVPELSRKASSSPSFPLRWSLFILTVHCSLFTVSLGHARRTLTRAVS